MTKLLTAIISASIFTLSSASFADKPEGVGGGKPEKVGGGKPDKVRGGKPDKANKDRSSRGKLGKIDICHNGETFDELQGIDVPVSFVINVNRNSLRAHLENHLDCDALIEELGPIEVCELEDDGVTVVCEEKEACNCLDPQVDVIEEEVPEEVL